ncbi:YgiT-type zinc finger protein [Aromatoleum toluclasticum]|uniref:DUF4258 domain-containing protein n=1 Tax=Aromatoleum toluclasticum TaxID=92003 RepID=UPI001D197DDF|nr:YgiT-type zinc finger protein [Aromatoleum toluclasticum]MCC4116662.1 YgiT-type zinc finger protein [Aromatoleum toluclasticum]
MPLPAPGRETAWIAARAGESHYALSEHVVRSLMAGRIAMPQIETALRSGRIIEEHRHGGRDPAYLLCAIHDGRPVHAVAAPRTDGWLAVIHAYVPAPPLWRTALHRSPGDPAMSDSITTCYFCGGAIKQVTVGNFDYRLEGRLYVIKKVPAGLCEQCGEKYVDAEVGRRLNALIAEQAFTGSEAVGVIDYAVAP